MIPRPPSATRTDTLFPLTSLFRSGIVNSGGCVASLATIFAIGVVLDSVAGGGSGDSYSLGAFKLAWSVQYVVWAIGVTGILRTRALVRARMAESGDRKSTRLNSGH